MGEMGNVNAAIARLLGFPTRHSGRCRSPLNAFGRTEAAAGPDLVETGAMVNSAFAEGRSLILNERREAGGYVLVFW